MSQESSASKSFNPRPGLIVGALLSVLLAALFAAYANHFHNSFHFDDFHTIVQNPAIRRLENIPRFFADGRTFSVLPTHQSYRPLVSASLALDYWLGKGLDPFWFHVSTFVWYAVQLGLMYLLFVRIMNLTGVRAQNVYWAIFAVACYALHPANAETINYIVQRGDVYSTFGVVAGLVTYCSWPRGRKWGIYLMPVAAGGLAKQTALIFPALLFVHLALFDDELRKTGGRLSSLQLRRVATACLPAAIFCALLAIFEISMTPKTFVAGAASRIQYWLTQPMVALHYFKSFFLPTELSADTDRQLAANIFSETSVIGFAFLAAMWAAVRYTLRSLNLRPIAFGLLWFLVALLPTSLIPLAEPDNDHRMFFPFVGLTLAAVWALKLLLEKKEKRWESSARWRVARVVGALCLLAACGYGAHLRNAVWRSEESLWKDVTEKSPRNGRGLMNYGLTQMAKGKAAVAYDYFQRAAALTPNYSTLEINLGIAAGLLRRDGEAEEHFRRAMALAPGDSQSYSFYGRWLESRNRIPEAITILNRAAVLNADDLDPRYALMAIYSRQADWSSLKGIASGVLRVSPADAEARRYLSLAQNAAMLPAPSAKPYPRQTPEGYLTLSLSYCQTERYLECVQAAQEALRLRPSYAEAYNNIAAGYESLGRWDEAIRAAQEAIRLKPDFQLARNNLAYSMSQKAQESKEASVVRRPAP